MANTKKATQEQIEELQDCDDFHEDGIDISNLTYAKAKSLIAKYDKREDAEQRKYRIESLEHAVDYSQYAKKLTKKPTKKELGVIFDACQAQKVYDYDDKKIQKQLVEALINNFPWLGSSKPRPKAQTNTKKKSSSGGCLLILIVCAVVYYLATR